MAKKADRDARESALASGWTVEADPSVEAARTRASRTRADPTIAGEETSISGIGAGDAGHGGIEGVSEESLPEHDEVLGEGASTRPQLGNGALVLLGVVGGLYLLYTWVWFSWARYYSQMNAEIAEASGSVGGVLQQVVFWAAPLAPGLWFLSVFLLCRGSRTWKLALWLIVGAVVLVPLPMFEFGGAS